MCGIFGYAGDGNVSARLLDEAVRGGLRRGPHGYGWASPGGVFRSLGAVALDKPEIVRRTVGDGAPWVLGHARLATFGMPRDESGLQPVTDAGHVLLHNGNVYNWRDLAAAFGVDGPTDSWVLGRIYSRLRDLGHAPREALATMLAPCQMKAGAFVVRDADGTLTAFRTHLPINVVTTDRSVYLSSARFAHSHPLPEGRVVTLKERP